MSQTAPAGIGARSAPRAAARLIRSIPSLGGLPGPAVGLIGLGIAALSLMVLLDALSLGLGVVLDGLGGVHAIFVEECPADFSRRLSELIGQAVEASRKARPQ